MLASCLVRFASPCPNLPPSLPHVLALPAIDSLNGQDYDGRAMLVREDQDPSLQQGDKPARRT